MEVIQKNEAFKKTDGQMRFSYVLIFAQQDGTLYSGKWRQRFQPPQTLSDLEELRPIQTEDRGPEVNSEWSSFIQTDEATAVYVKTPSLLGYINGHLEQQITREIETCEVLRKNPHPNIATYYGYQETHGRVSGLCFKRYMSSLLDAVNPQRCGKAAFLSSPRDRVTYNMRSSLEEGILAAIKHLHSLGLVHNDINPANIMLDADGSTLILIDFDSCRYIGEPLRSTDTKRTHHWHDLAVEISLEKNDLDAFKELRIWLSGSTDEDFLFE
ncbi:hypothetical protein FE257_008903 [Aspergillus nanangensis]|uniref:Autophagy-related protein 1 n=1 Tax=Aspergillus nanangensis TaxID=2582783 RepID=A0AAD4CWU5_ASPNN|nr:hypothetical protein FE257_008903 [Aspergillus nanangensis]